MPIKDIPIELIDSNPYNSRIMCQQEDIETLSKSLSLKGLLSPIMVRSSDGRFQVIFGHRRVRAARLLDWKSIRAECVESISDEEMLQLSLLENFARKDLSSYETALCFQRMIREFGKTHEEIARTFGCSRSYVSNHLRMLNLVDKEAVVKDETLYSRMRSISEHHARLILQVDRPEDRMELLKLVSEQNLSVRELHRIIHGLRGWFINEENSDAQDENRRRDDFRTTGAGLQEVTIDLNGRDVTSRSHANDLFEIQKTLVAEFELPHSNDFESFSTHHDFDSDFSIFSEFPPLGRFEGERGFEKVKNWFFRIAPSWTTNIEDVRVRFFENSIALATLYVSYKRRPTSKRGIRASGTIVFVRKESSWKIVHEHWSQLKQYKKGKRQSSRELLSSEDIVRTRRSQRQNNVSRETNKVVSEVNL